MNTSKHILNIFDQSSFYAETVFFVFMGTFNRLHFVTLIRLLFASIAFRENTGGLTEILALIAYMTVLAADQAVPLSTL